jgi:Domain of unknown function (DUF4286)
MLVYNITVKIEPGMETDWLRWQQEEHIPQIMATGLFTEYKFFKLLEQDETDGPTFIVQYFSASRANYDRYIDEFAPGLRNRALSLWGNHFVAFRTLMQVVN